MPSNKSFFDLTSAEIKELSRLTTEEKTAVDNFIQAAKALPKLITVSIADSDDGLLLSKKITKGSTQVVARIKKKSLIF